MELPCAIESEEALLGAAIINPLVLEEVVISPDEFYVHRNGWVWEAGLSLLGKGLPVDLVTVTEELDKMGKLKKIGGPAYLTKLATKTPSSLHAEGYAVRIKETAVRRKMIQEASHLLKNAYDEERDIGDSVQEHIENVGLLRGMSGDMKTAEQVHGEFEKRVSQGNIAVPWGIGGMDSATGGKERETLIVVAARPGMGKTSLILQAARNDSNKMRAGIFALEMGAVSMWQRIACPYVGVSWKDVIADTISDAKKGELINISKKLAKKYVNLYIDDTPALTTSDIYQKTLQNKLDVIYVDHLWLVGDSPDKKEVQRLGDIAMRLKNLSKTLEIPVVLVSQLSRNVEHRKNKRPLLSDLRESGKIEEAADTVLMLYRPEYYGEEGDYTEVLIRKFRNGDPNAFVRLKFDTEKQWFSSMQDIKIGAGYEPKV